MLSPDRIFFKVFVNYVYLSLIRIFPDFEDKEDDFFLSAI